MNKVLSFTYNGTRLFAFSGVQSLVNKLGSFTNAVNLNAATSNADVAKLFVQESILPVSSVEQIPLMSVKTIEKDGNFYVAAGTIVLGDGNEYSVQVEKDDIVILDNQGKLVTDLTKRVPEPTPIPVPVPAPAFMPKSLKLTLGSGGSFTGCSFQRGAEKSKQLTVDSVLSSMSRDDLYALHLKLMERFEPKREEKPKQTPPQQQQQQQNQQHQQKTQVQQQQQQQKPQQQQPPQQRNNQSRDAVSVEDFLETLDPLVAKTLQSIPYTLLKECKVSTAHPIDVSELLAGGEEYCVANKWQLEFDFYAIDCLKNTERHFYNRTTGEHCAIPLKTLRKWRDTIRQ